MATHGQRLAVTYKENSLLLQKLEWLGTGKFMRGANV